MADLLPRGIRNNNPGNLRRGADRWQGLADVQADKSFWQFTAAHWGLRALAKTLRTYQERHGLKTPRQIVGRWAPPSENDTEAYIQAFAAFLGVQADDPVDLSDPETMARAVFAIVKHENGATFYPASVVDEAVRAAFAS